MTRDELITPRELDRILRYPRGRSARLARTGKLDCIRLPDGEIRFTLSQVHRLKGETTVAHDEGVDHAR
jgi:hypothetical protein